MNLLHKLPFQCQADGNTHHRVPFTRLVEPQWRDIWAPRPDFRGAAYQFAIGVLQTAFAPEDKREWKHYWDTPPDAATLEKCLAPIMDAFRFDAGSPSFMQDFDLPEAESKEVASLLIESPGEKTIRDNLDHFIKRGRVEAVDAAWAALALFTLQINAPSGGVGHRVSLRGGGPLTTLLVPLDPEASLWQKLWLNVLPKDEYGGEPVERWPDVFPWLAPTRTSEAKTGVVTTPETAHALQAYWSMPRRIRLDWADARQGRCDLSGEESEQLLRTYQARNYGVNYAGAWRHPLTPYTLDPKNDPLSIKGQRGGIAYRHWLGLTLGNADNKPAAAQVVQYYHRVRHGQIPARLWCFGFDMDNMKARCWYDSMLPVHSVEPMSLPKFTRYVQQVLDTAQEAAFLLKKQVRQALYGGGGDGVPVEQSYWQATEPLFYACVADLTQCDIEDEEQVAAVLRRWLLQNRSRTLALFDDWVQRVPIEMQDMKRVVLARAELLKWMSAGKPFKSLWSIVNTYPQQEAA